jgi:hypothetical protein
MRKQRMKYTLTWRRAAAGLALLVAGCSGSLDVENPNAPDRERAFEDPATIAAVAGGAIRTWLVNRQEYNSGLLLNSMADGYTASWNNFNLRYYTSEGFLGAGECADRCAWVNSILSTFYDQLEFFWYGYYSALSSANDALTAIRINDVVISDEETTRMVETIAAMMQGVTLGHIALNYDQGFIVDENTDLTDPTTLPLSTREEMRVAAIQKLEEAHALAVANEFETPETWTGIVNGPSYTNTEIAMLIRTLQAEILAHFPRTSEENATVDWAAVKAFAEGGIDGTFNAGAGFGFFQDLDVWYDGTKNWGNDITTMRVDTRLATRFTAGPTGVHEDPWPGSLNPQPDATDNRVGNGTWGPPSNQPGGFLGVGTIPEDAGAGTDYAYAGSTHGPSARGTYHWSQLGHVRYSYLAYPGYGLPTENGQGFSPVYTKTSNDLLRAEAELELGNLATAATFINLTRVGRGGLPAVAAGDGEQTLREALWYEQDIELLGFGPDIFYNKRRRPAETQGATAFGLAPDTPREMPMPARDLALLQMELYTFGGPGNDCGGCATSVSRFGKVKNVRERWAELEKKSRAQWGRGSRK